MHEGTWKLELLNLPHLKLTQQCEPLLKGTPSELIGARGYEAIPNNPPLQNEARAIS